MFARSHKTTKKTTLKKQKKLSTTPEEKKTAYTFAGSDSLRYFESEWVLDAKKRNESEINTERFVVVQIHKLTYGNVSVCLK